MPVLSLTKGTPMNAENLSPQRTRRTQMDADERG